MLEETKYMVVVAMGIEEDEIAKSSSSYSLDVHDPIFT